MDRRKLPSQGPLEGAFLDLWQHCDHCGKRNWGTEKPKRCGGCGVVIYCDKECQRAAWKAHRLLCRSAPEKGTSLSKELGYATPMALATALGEWVRIHTWSLNTLVDSAVYLEGGIDALLSSDSRPPAFLMPVAPRHATARTGNPSEAFEVLGRVITRKGDYPVFQELWGKVEAQYDSVAQTLRAQGFFDEPVVGGLLPAIYLIPNISICVLQTHAVLRFPIQHVEDDAQDEHTRAAFRDMQEVVMEGISDEAMVFRCTSDSARSEPDLGTFVHHKKAWKWQYLDPNAWDRFDKHVRPRTKPVTDLPARSLLSLFDTRNVRDAALRLMPLTVKDSQLIFSPNNNVEIRALCNHGFKPATPHIA